MRLPRLLCLLAMLVPACAGAQTLRIGVQAPFVVDPQFLFLGPNMAAAREIFDSFVGRDADARWTPSLAISWRQVDPLDWEFKLRQGVVFQDGSPFTAADVVATLARVGALPNNPGPYTANLRTVIGTQIVDPHTLIVHTDRPNPTLPGQFTNIFIVPEHLASLPGEAGSSRIAVGTGPYRLTRFQYGDGMTLTRNDAYWGPKPAYQTVEIKVITRDGPREAALLSGDIDLMENVPTADVARLKANPAIRIFARPADRVVFLEPNTGADTLKLLQDKTGQPLPANPLRDLRVRQAMSIAIGRTALVDRVLAGQGVPTMQVVPEGFAGWSPGIPIPKPDPARAKALLAEAGYPDGFRMTIACTNDRYVNDGQICQALAQMLSRAGLETAVDAQPGSIFMARTRAGKNEQPVLLYAISLSSLRDAAYILALVAHSPDDARGFGDGNRGGFSDPSLDQLIEAAIIRSDAGREAAIEQAARETVARLGMIPLYDEYTIAAARAGIVYEPRMDEQLVAQNARPAPEPPKEAP